MAGAAPNWSALGSNFDVKGGLFGGQVGYNWQFGQFVYGLEADVDWTDIHGNSLVNGAAGCAANVCSTKNNFLSTARGRVGYAVDRWMPYLTGGLAVGNIDTTTPFTTGVDQTKAGWTIGGGVEFALVGQLDGEGRVPPRRPRQHLLRRRLRVPRRQQRRFHHQYRARGVNFRF